MKVLVLSSHTPSLLWFRMDMMKEFLKYGYEVVAIGNEQESKWINEFSNNDIKYRQARISRNGTNPLKDILTFFSILKILLEEKPDRIFAYQAKTVIYGSLAAKCLRIREFYPLIAGTGSVFMGKSFKSRIVKAIMVLEYKISLKRIKTIFFQNDDDIKLFKENGIIKKQHIVKLNGSGVNLEKFKSSELPNSFSLLFIGRLIKDKGVSEYLEACRIIKRKYPNIKCMLVGPYDTNPSAISEEELNAYIDDGTIEYYGEQRDVCSYIKECSVYILPSYREGTPKTVLEAMAVGRPIITTDAPGCRETVMDGINGYLIPIKDSSSIVEKVEKLYTNKELLINMSNESRKMAELKYDVNLVNSVIVESMNL